MVSIMALSVDDFLKKLGVDETLEAYEMIPFDYFNAEKGTDFTAGISMSGDEKFIDCEIQMIRQENQEDQPSFKQILLLRAEQDTKKNYSPIYLKVMGKVLSGVERDWFENGTRFFKMCISHIKKGMIPDFDVIYKSCFGKKKEGDGSSYFGGGSSRNLKNDKSSIKPPGKL